MTENIIARLAVMKGELTAELTKAFFDKYEVVEIQLTEEKYEQIKEQFEIMTGEIAHISEMWGIPVVVSPRVPNNVAFLIAEKKKEEVV